MLNKIITNTKLFKNKNLSEGANDFEGYIMKEEMLRGHLKITLAVMSTYDSWRRERIANKYVKRISEGKTRVFKLNDVVEYINFIQKDMEPKTWIYNKAKYIDKCNRYYRAFAYYEAMQTIIKST